MVDENICIGYSEKIRKYDELEIKSEKLRKELSLIGEEYKQASNVIKFLKIKSFIVDTNLTKYATNVEEKYKQVLKTTDTVLESMDELKDHGLIPGSFRHIIFSLCKEIGKTLDELAIELKCPNKDTINILCKDGYIDKESYIKVCRYFNLNEKSKRYIRVIGK